MADVIQLKQHPDVKDVLKDLRAMNPEGIVLLVFQDGNLHFRTGGQFSKAQTIGSLEIMKMWLFESMNK